MDYFRKTRHIGGYLYRYARTHYVIASIIIGTIIRALIKGIRPFLGPQGCCKYRPTCSQFAQQELKTNVLHKALWNIFIRLLSCNPFTS